MTDEEFSRIVKYTAVRYGINLYQSERVGEEPWRYGYHAKD